MDIIDLLPKILEYGGSLAQLALVIVFVYVFKNGKTKDSSGSIKGVEDAVALLGSNHITHLNENMEKLITQSAIQTEILRDIKDRLK